MTPGFKSDHSFVEMELCEMESPRGKGMWKLNSMLLDKPEYTFNIYQTIDKAKIVHAESSLDIL